MKIRLYMILALILMAVALALSPLSRAFAQTPSAPPPLPSGVKKQIGQQAKGNFGSQTELTASEPRGPAGQIQEVWNTDQKSVATVTTGKGTVSFDECDDCVYQIVTREFMISTVLLPAGEKIITPIDVGESGSFQVKARGNSRFAIKPLKVGVDSNIVVYTKSGKEYQFYIQADAFNSNRIPHLKIKIKGVDSSLPSMPPDQLDNAPANKSSFDAMQVKADSGDQVTEDAKAVDSSTVDEGKQDYINNVQFKPGGIHGFNEYRVFGSKELEPTVVYRNERFTYIHYGKKWTELELPTAYVVYDDVDELVNTRVSGTTFIIESLSKRITLKAGQKYICIVYEGSA